MQDAEYKQCQRCGGPLDEGKRFCSKTCWRAFEAEQAPAGWRCCERCGEAIKARGSKRKYCSQECARLASRGRSLPAEQRAKIAESNRRTKAAQRAAGFVRRTPKPRTPKDTAGPCIDCGEFAEKRVHGVRCQRCYSANRYRARREHHLALGRAWRERNPGYFAQPHLVDRNKTRQQERYFGGLRPTVIERDASRCQECGTVCVEMERGPRLLAVHHIDGDPTNNVMENLAVVCASCHAKIHHRQGDYVPPAR